MEWAKRLKEGFNKLTKQDTFSKGGGHRLGTAEEAGIDKNKVKRPAAVCLVLCHPMHACAPQLSCTLQHGYGVPTSRATSQPPLRPRPAAVPLSNAADDSSGGFNPYRATVGASRRCIACAPALGHVLPECTS